MADLKEEIGKIVGRLRKNEPTISWESPEKLHITIAFFPYLGTQHLAFTQSTLDFLANTHKTFNLKVTNLAYFYKRHENSIVFLGIEDPDKKLRAFYNNLKEKLGEEKLFLKERLDPYLTIGRLKRRRYIHETKEILADTTRNEITLNQEFEVASIDLYESLFRRDENTSQYRLVNRFPFTPSAAD